MPIGKRDRRQPFSRTKISFIRDLGSVQKFVLLLSVSVTNKMHVPHNPTGVYVHWTSSEVGLTKAIIALCLERFKLIVKYDARDLRAYGDACALNDTRGDLSKPTMKARTAKAKSNLKTRFMIQEPTTESDHT